MLTISAKLQIKKYQLHIFFLRILIKAFLFLIYLFTKKKKFNTLIEIVKDLPLREEYPEYSLLSDFSLDLDLK